MFVALTWSAREGLQTMRFASYFDLKYWKLFRLAKESCSKQWDLFLENCTTSVNAFLQAPSLESRFWNLVEILKFGRDSEIWSRFWNLVEILKFGGNSEIWLRFWNLVEILKFGRDSEIWSRFWNLVEILKFGWDSSSTRVTSVKSTKHQFETDTWTHRSDPRYTWVR